MGMTFDGVEAWTVAVGEIRPFAIGKLRRMQKEALEFVKGTEGFLGIHPAPGRGTLLLYRTKNDAIRAKNLLDAKGCQTGKNICQCYIPREFVKDE